MTTEHLEARIDQLERALRANRRRAAVWPLAAAVAIAWSCAAKQPTEIHIGDVTIDRDGVRIENAGKESTRLTTKGLSIESMLGKDEYAVGTVTIGGGVAGDSIKLSTIPTPTIEVSTKTASAVLQAAGSSAEARVTGADEKALLHAEAAHASVEMRRADTAFAIMETTPRDASVTISGDLQHLAGASEAQGSGAWTIQGASKK